jgi:hypothetical protein
LQWLKKHEEIERAFEVHICLTAPPISELSDLQENELFVRAITCVVERE